LLIITKIKPSKILLQRMNPRLLSPSLPPGNKYLRFELAVHQMLIIDKCRSDSESVRLDHLVVRIMCELLVKERRRWTILFFILYSTDKSSPLLLLTVFVLSTLLSGNKITFLQISFSSTLTLHYCCHCHMAICHRYELY
jgi:hypothetical protein